MEIKYVRQRTAKRIIAAVGTVTACLATVIAIVSILAQRPGAFVVSLDNKGAKLSLCESVNSDTQMTYMNAGEVSPFVEYENGLIDDMFTPDILDAETFDYKANASTAHGSTKFFQCCFYVKNVGNINAGYNLSLNFTNVTRSVTDGYELDSVLRVRFYENKVVSDGEQTHNYKTYAKVSGRNWHIDEEGNKSFNEQISKEGSGWAEPFASQYVVLNSKITNLAPEEMYRYTFIVWIEGNDPECIGEAPLESKLNLGVSISSYEAKEE